jgi:hypothetical protein
MVYKFKGTFEELRGLIKTAGLDGKWVNSWEGNRHRFRSHDGGALSWWPSNGSVQIQGQRAAKVKLEMAFVRKSSALINDIMPQASNAVMQH